MVVKMDNIFEKTSSYNLLNNLIPGSIFSFLLNNFCTIDIVSKNTIESLLIYYFLGIFLNRIGSLIVEPISKRIKFVSFSNYDDYIEASEIDSKIDILLETNNLYRTIATTGIIIILIKIFINIINHINMISNIFPYIILLLLIIIFLLSYRKQATYINKRINNAIKNKK